MAIGEEAERRISAEKVLRDALGYVRRQWKAMLLFTAAALGLILLSIKAGGIEGYGFWPALVALYLLESVFFRFYFAKRPYLQWRPIAVSLIPSVKVMFLAAVFAVLLSLLPFVPLLLGIPYFEEYMNSLAYADDYLSFLQRYMQDVPLVDVGLNAVLILVSPFILFRPMLAWIAAVMGRRGSLRLAWRKSKGNYRPFVLLGAALLIPLMILYHIGVSVPKVRFYTDLLSVPLMMYLNVVLAGIYDWFYQD
jgi:membrane protein